MRSFAGTDRHPGLTPGLPVSASVRCRFILRRDPTQLGDLPENPEGP